MKRRCFIAIPMHLDDDGSVAKALSVLRKRATQKDLDIKWTRPENYHVTLAFLGDRQESELETAKVVLGEVAKNFSTFALRVRGVGAFPEVRGARVLWFGVQAKSVLKEMAAVLRERLEEHRLLPDLPEDFSPHMTIARLRNPRAVEDLVSPFARKEFVRSRVEQICLYESHLQANYPVYQLLQSEPLQPAPEVET